MPQLGFNCSHTHKLTCEYVNLRASENSQAPLHENDLKVMAVRDLLTTRINNHEAQFLFQGLSRYESAQFTRSEKLPLAERSEVSICANFQTALELIKKSASPGRTLAEIVATVGADGLTTSFPQPPEVHMCTSAHVNCESPFADSASEGLLSGASRKIVQSKSGNLTTGGIVNPPLLGKEAIPVAAIDCFTTSVALHFCEVVRITRHDGYDTSTAVL